MCDKCGVVSNIKYYSYNKCQHNGKYYCNRCNKKRGEQNPNWNAEKTNEERQNGRNYPEYYDFIINVLSRDKYTCQCCNSKKELVVHHLNGYSWYIEGRTDVTNAITLCSNCHKSFHSLYGFSNNTKFQFEEWFGKTLELLPFNNNVAPRRKVFCYETNKTYDCALECSKDIKSLKSEVYDCCNHKQHSLKGKHFFWLDEYEKMTKEEVDSFINYKYRTNNKGVICVTYGDVFESITSASRFYHIADRGIIFCCKGKFNVYGRSSDGTKLQWMYYEDFVQLPLNEQIKILNRKERYYDKLG